MAATPAEDAPEDAPNAADAGAGTGLSADRARALAREYWRLWLRNGRAPFPLDPPDDETDLKEAAEDPAAPEREAET